MKVSAAAGDIDQHDTPTVDLLEIFATAASFGHTASQRGQKQVARRARAVLAQPELADGPLTNASMMRGQIAVVRRGDKTFVQKARRVQAAGATGLIVINNSEAPCLPVANDTDRGDDIIIDVVCVRHSDGESLLQTLGFKNCLVTLTMGPWASATRVSEGMPPHRSPEVN